MKWSDRKIIKEDVESGAPTNSTDPESFATYAAPLFTAKRFGRMQEFVIPHDMYSQMRYGRTLGDRWLNYVEDATLQAAIRKAYHDDEELLLTCALTGAGCIVRKHRLARQQTSGEGIEGC